RGCRYHIGIRNKADARIRIKNVDSRPGKRGKEKFHCPFEQIKAYPDMLRQIEKSVPRKRQAC
ncbi:MAG: hypothetical protein MI892_12185, partial [Desulfobacterales bacterium]|nr:hypothetical protein [Desulfobacterales bacterium]